MLSVVLVQLSNNPVRLSPTLIDPPTKHWLQEFVVNAGFVEHATDLYSPRDDPILGAGAAIGVGVVGAALSSGVVGAALSSGVVGADVVLTTGWTGFVERVTLVGAGICVGSTVSAAKIGVTDIIDVTTDTASNLYIVRNV
jgi:hypothetical protein